MDIKIFISCDKDSYVPNNPYLYPVQVGSALAKNRFSTMLHDDEGDNISEKNRSYCELTAQYWAWKNQDADYYGFFHYRRYLCFNEEIQDDDVYGNVLADRITDATLQKLSIEPSIMKQYIESHDAVVVRKRKILSVDNIYDEYDASPLQHKEDLDKTLGIVLKKYPEFKEAIEKYFSSDMAYDCNMFIMKKDMFNTYCNWLFDILEESEKVIDTTNYNVQEYRVYGFLAERLCGLYFTYLEMQGKYNIGKLPKVLFKNTNKLKKVEPVSKEAIPVILSADDRFAPFLEVMIRSIALKASEDRIYDIVVLHSNITEKNQKVIKDFNQKDNFMIRFVNVDDYFDRSKFFVNQHLSVETYYRLIIPEIMPAYHKVIYLDCDMVVEKDVAELFDLDLNGNIVAAVKDLDIAGQVKTNMNDISKYIREELGISNPFDYAQAGTLVLDLDALRQITSSEELLKVATSKSFRCHDQDVLNKMFAGKIHYLPQEWNVIMDWENPPVHTSRMQFLKMAPREMYNEYQVARTHPFIVHYAGYQKPWECVDCDMAEYFWNIAKDSPFYPLIQSKVRYNLADERHYASRAVAPIPHRSRLRRAYDFLVAHGVSCFIINFFRKGTKKVISIISK